MIMRPIFFAIIFLFFPHLDSFAQVSDAEQQALIDLYEATDGDNWYRQEGWLEDPDVCSWEGVKCGSANVIELALIKNNLSGEIPASITDLQHLEYLSMEGNRLSGRLPSELLSGLKSTNNQFVVDLSDNALSGDLPEFVDNEEVGFWYPRELNLSRNQFTGDLPVSWSEIAELKALDLCDNQLTGTIPGEWASFGLEVLRLQGNRFAGELPAVLADMSAMRELSLARNDFAGPLPAWLGQLELEKLFLQGNRLSGVIDNAVEAMDASSRFVELNLADNHFSGPIPPTLTDLEFWSFAPVFGIRNAFLPGLDLCWNDFEPPGPELLNFLSTHQEGGDILSCLGQQRIKLDPTISGTWFDLERAGEGFVQQLLPGGAMFVYWFSYSPRLDETGHQFWAFEAVTAGENHARFEPVYAPTGGQFSQGLGDRPVEFNPSSAGRIFIDHLGNGEQQARYSQLGQERCSGSLCGGGPFATTDSGTFNQIQLTRLAGTTCDNQHPHQEISAIWLSPHSNEGFVVEVIEDGRGVVYWFTYEPNDSGRQAWMTGVGEFHDDTLYIDELVQPVGGRFGRLFDPDEVEYRNWGTLTLEFDDFWNGQAHWDSEFESYGAGSYPIRRLTLPMLAECE